MGGIADMPDIAEMPDIAGAIAHFGIGARASIATVHQGTGYFAVTPKTPYDGALSTAEQADQLFEKAEARLSQIGSSKQGLLFVAILLRDIGDVAAFNARWDAWVAGVTPPARACFEARLANPDMKVEMIMVCAAAPGDDAQT